MPLPLSFLSPSCISSAWSWLCVQRKNFPACDDIWFLRFHKHIRQANIIRALRSNSFSFSPALRIVKSDGSSLILWSATDSFVQKLLSIHLQKKLPMHKQCTHIKGHGGHKFAIRQVNQWIQSGEYVFVCRTDIRGYYANINKYQLVEQLASYIHNPIILNLLTQFIFYTVEYGGTFHTPIKGISRGSPLSPMPAAFQLYDIDKYFAEQAHLKYIRYMDDFIILCKTRHHLRHAVKQLNSFLNRFAFEKHPDKTFIGKIGKTFDFLGYHFDAQGICGLATSTLAHQADSKYKCNSD